MFLFPKSHQRGICLPFPTLLRKLHSLCEKISLSIFLNIWLFLDSVPPRQEVGVYLVNNTSLRISLNVYFANVLSTRCPFILAMMVKYNLFFLAVVIT